MTAPWAVSVLNTFIHVPVKFLELDDGGPVRKVDSDPLPRRWFDRTEALESRLARLEREAEIRDISSCWVPLTEDECNDSASTASLDSTPSFDGLEDCFQAIAGSDICGGVSASLESSRQQSTLSTPRTTASEPAIASQAALAPRPQLALDSAQHQVPVVMPMVWFMPVPAGQRGHLAAQPTPGERYSCISWALDAELTRSEANKVESENITVNIPGSGLHPFQIILYAVGNQGKRGSRGFQRSCGHGRVEVRCLSQLPVGTGSFFVSAAVGTGERAQSPRPPVLHDFSRRPCCSWRKWDFRAAADPSTRKLTVRITLMPPIGARM